MLKYTDLATKAEYTKSKKLIIQVSTHHPKTDFEFTVLSGVSSKRNRLYLTLQMQ